jgi:LmbE family N-acetylglucosaminyl deacetylase
VFCPWPQENHCDHLSTFRLLQQALRRYLRPLHIWLYEVWTPLTRPSICVPIDATMDAKVAAILAHQSQLRCLDYRQAFEGLAAFRSLFCPGSRYAEAFLTADRDWVVGQT